MPIKTTVKTIEVPSSIVVCGCGKEAPNDGDGPRTIIGSRDGEHALFSASGWATVTWARGKEEEIDVACPDCAEKAVATVRALLRGTRAG